VAQVPPSGSLLRLEVDDDPDGGLLVYAALMSQDTSQLTGSGWLERVEVIQRLKSRLAGVEAER